MKTIKNKAFTLVELVVVIVILSILGTIGILAMNSYSRDARDAKRLTDVTNIRDTITMQVANSSTNYKKILPNTATGYKQNILTIGGAGAVGYQGILDYSTLNLVGKDFESYPFAYTQGAVCKGEGSYVTESGQCKNGVWEGYDFIQLFYVSEKDKKVHLVGNYDLLSQGDSPTLFIVSGEYVTDNMMIKNNKDTAKDVLNY